jgi:hypothetical protein
MSKKRGLTNKERKEAAADLARLTVEQKQALYQKSLAVSARTNDDPFGFADFYKVIHGKPMPDHAFYEWVIPMYWAAGKISADDVIMFYSKAPEYNDIIEEIKAQFLDIGQVARGIVIEAFRGSTKTTTVTITFCAFRIGHEPHRANLLIQVGDDIATDNTRQIADIIENNPGWKRVFPHVVPDRDMGWGAGGYEVKVIHDTKTGEEIEYSAWRSINSKRKDPTLVGVGYKSRQIIGKHPDGLLVIDDIHDENNTSSRREQEKVRQVLLGTIFPTMTTDTWKVFIGTPWNENDTLHYVASIGEFLHVKTPVRRGDELTWEEMFPQDEVDKRARISGSREFARMYMLDLSFSKNRVFKYQLYPSSEIRFNWAMCGGVDYAGTMDEYTNKAGRNDYFAMAYTAKLPVGGAVCVDGVLDHCSQDQGETYVKRPQEIFPGWLSSVVEADGAGEAFIQTIRRNPGLRIIPMKTQGRGKGKRLELEMAPWLENGTVRISDAETPFLNELRHELDTYPDCENDDALDALYWSMRGMPDVLVMRDNEDELPKPETINRRKKQPSPFMAFGRT